ncbi:MAG: hypothetical protein ACLFVI_06120 [Archaeoglobaceae archaeon]
MRVAKLDVDYSISIAIPRPDLIVLDGYYCMEVMGRLEGLL